MKNLLIKALGVSLCFYSISSFADRMVITGKPALLNLHEGFFVLPPTYIAPVGYRFVRFTETNRVCFLNLMPQFASLDRVQIVLEENGQKMKWQCYEYNPMYFELDY